MLPPKLRDTLAHSLIALLYALGLCWTLLAALDIPSQALPAAIVATGLVALLTAGSFTRLTRWCTGLLLAVGAGAWLMSGGAGTVAEILRGVTLHLSGVAAALPMVARETGMVLAVISALAAWGLTHRAAGAYPCIALLMMVLLLLWLGNAPDALPWLLPAVIAALTMIAFSAHESIGLRRVLPMMAAVAAGAFLLIPTGGVSIAPMKEAADQLRQKIFDYFFFTEPRDVFSLALEGYYPQGQNQLGGRPNPSDRPVMQVVAPRRAYLRGVIKNEYTGRAWRDTTGGRRYLWNSLRWESSREEIFDQLRPGETVSASSLLAPSTVSVRMLTDSTSTLFVPQRIRSLQPGGDLVPYFNSGSEVFATRNLLPGDTWSVQAPLIMAGDTGLGTLLQACAAVSDPDYEDIRRAYTVLPSHLQQEIYDLARRVTQDAATPYDMVLALQNHLQRSYRYTLDVAPQPPEQDFVTTFLLQTKEGYCTYFASAMTVLCRMVGLPARYVEGYTAVPDESGHAVVTGEDGHAWTEVYFAGFGWLTVDATPWASGTADAQNNSDPDDPPPSEEPEDTPTPPPPSESDAPEDTPTPEPSEAPQETSTPEPDSVTEDGGEEKKDRSWLWWLLAVLLAAAAGARMYMVTPGVRAARAKDATARWMVWTQAAHDALRARGLRRESGETPIAFMDRVDGMQVVKGALRPLGEMEALVFYGRMEPAPEDMEMARETYRAVWRSLKLHQRLLMCLRRSMGKKTSL